MVKNVPDNARDTRNASLISYLGRSTEVRNGNPLQYSCLEISMDRGAWLATVHGATESWIWLRLNTHIICLWTLFTLFHSFCSSDWVISNVLSSRSVILSSACLNLLFRRRQWHPTPVFLHGKSHGWRSLVDTFHGVARSWTQLSDFPFTFHFHALEKEMATRSSVFAWKFPGMAEPGELPSMGSHRVGHGWSDLERERETVHYYVLLPLCSAL